jgi:hypothetical protein
LVYHASRLHILLIPSRTGILGVPGGVVGTCIHWIRRGVRVRSAGGKEGNWPGRGLGRVVGAEMDMASVLLNSRHVKMCGSSMVVYGRRARLESAVAMDSGFRNSLCVGSRTGSECRPLSVSLMQQQEGWKWQASGVATVRRVETHKGTSAGRSGKMRNQGLRRCQRRNVFRRFLGEPASVLEQRSNSRG